jgi:hypothetical protein
MRAQNKDITPAISENYIDDILSLTNSTLLTADTILRCTKKSCSQLMIFLSFSTETNIIPCSYRDPLSHPISCTPNKSNLYLANSVAAVVNELDLYRPYIRDTKPHVRFPLLRLYQGFSPGPRHMCQFRNKASFYSEELSTPRPTSKLEDHALSAVYDFLFYLFAATPHIGGRSSIRMSGAIPYFLCKPPCRGEGQRLETDNRRETNTFIHCIICELNTVRRTEREGEEK